MKLFKKRKSLKLSFAVIGFTFVITSTGCASTQHKMPAIEPHYLLTGTFVDTDGTFDYYDIGNNELAIALNETNRTSYKKTRFSC